MDELITEYLESNGITFQLAAIDADGEEDAPAVAEPLVEVDFALGGLGLEVRSNVAKTDSHN